MAARKFGVQLPVCGPWNPGVRGASTGRHIYPYRRACGVSARCIHHGFQFDRISPYKPASAVPSDQLDDVSRIAVKTLPFPSEIKDKLFQLIKAAGKKKDLDACGSYVARRLATRRCVEVPRVLPSILLDGDSPDTEYVEEMKRLAGDPKFAHLNALFQQNKLGANEQAQVELAEAEDARHRVGVTAGQIHLTVELHHTLFTQHRNCAYGAHLLRELRGLSAHIQRGASARRVGEPMCAQMKQRAPRFRPSRMMFYNAGAGAAVAAANTIWDLEAFADVLVVERSRNLQKICEFLLPEFKGLRYQSDDYDSTDLFDCVVVPYSLTNIRGSQARSLLVKNLWNKLNVGGYLVSAVAKGLTRELAERHEFNRALRQCPHEGLCPLALTGKDWCHFSQRIYRVPHYLYKKGSIARSIDNEKYSYLVVGKAPGPRQKLKSEAEAASAEEKSFFWPRIVMAPLKLGRRVIMDVCAAPNNFKRIIVPKNTPESSGYKYARDAMWGDLWRFPHREQRPIARAYTPDNVKPRLLSSNELEEKLKGPFGRLGRVDASFQRQNLGVPADDHMRPVNHKVHPGALQMFDHRPLGVQQNAESQLVLLDPISGGVAGASRQAVNLVAQGVEGVHGRAEVARLLGAKGRVYGRKEEHN
ncbi:mitochondrial ribosomal protein S22 precursor, putative [Babesia caballi]|uniref:Mitochondrial ribosomal protein S22, putative n=1 Tax=Babesia caballi TaxID=5871 RepID=A0AAV4M2N6_BABCB|nr:mitochondrial ribosomal protein S22 precursor, putative [Babesia caballi]